MVFVLSALPCFAQGVQKSDRRDEGVQSSLLDERSVLQNLVQYDSIYKSGFAASATEQRMDRIDISGPFYRVETRWKLTFEGDRAGYFKEVTDYEKPKYLPPDKRRWAAESKTGKAANGEAMLVALRTKEWGYWGDEACGTHFGDATLKVTPDGQVTEAGAIFNSSLYPPRDISPVAALSSFQWALGRFFSDRIDKIMHVEKKSDGRLHASAIGSMYKGSIGKWELEIEPDAAWMVRKARFYPKSKPDRIDAEMSNEGTVWSGSFCIPKEAWVNFWGPIEDMETIRKTYTQHLTFKPVVDRFDEKLYEQCQQAVLHSKQPKLTVIDGRVSPPAITQPNLPKSTGFTPIARNPFRWWVVMANLIAIVVLLAAWVSRKKWKQQKRHADF